MENKITREEMIEWFGNEAPIEAINLIWNSGGSKTLGEMRTELRAMGQAALKRRPAAQSNKHKAAD
jgi:hypothetical protein